MPNAEDIVAQQKLLQAHRQTLHVLLTQQAQFGMAYTPPAVIHGIRAARTAIAEIKNNLSQSGVQETDLPNDVEPSASSTSTITSALQGTPTAGGDVIMAHIGAGAQGIAVGKNIQQTISTATSPAEDQQAITILFEQLAHEITTSQAENATQAMATFQVRLLAGELHKVGATTVPSASTIAQVVDGLLTGIPSLKATLRTLFNTPAVLRVIQRADMPLDTWLQQRFGG